MLRSEINEFIELWMGIDFTNKHAQHRPTRAQNEAEKL